MIELSSPIKRKRIQAEPELLRVEVEGPKSAVVSRPLMVILSFAYALFYLFAMNYVFNTYADDNSFRIFASIFITLSFVCIAVLVIVSSSRKPLIFTSIGIVGRALMAIKYEQLDGYNWERCKGLNSSKTTLVLLPKGIFSEGEFRSYQGMSIFEFYGYFFNNEQIRTAEEILEKAGVVKVNIRPWR